MASYKILWAYLVPKFVLLIDNWLQSELGYSKINYEVSYCIGFWVNRWCSYIRTCQVKRKINHSFALWSVLMHESGSYLTRTTEGSLACKATAQHYHLQVLKLGRDLRMRLTKERVLVIFQKASEVITEQWEHEIFLGLAWIQIHQLTVCLHIHWVCSCTNAKC